MPIYEYRCQNGHTFEVFQSMSDDPATACEECGAPVERVFHPVAIHFKGSGFHNTDYKKAGQGANSGKEGGESGSGDGGSGSGDGQAESGSGKKKKDSGKAEKGSESKAEASD